MVDVLLLKALVERIKTIVKDYRVADEKGNLSPVTVVEWFLPPKRSQDDEEYEKNGVFVRLLDGKLSWNKETQMTEAVTKAVISVRTCSRDTIAGPTNTANLMARIQQGIYAAPVLDGRYRATFPAEWTAPDGQAYPFWEGAMTIPWLRPMPQEIIDTVGGMEDYG